MDDNEQAARKKLPFSKVFFYSFGTFGYTLQQSVTNTFYFYFLTNVIYLSSATVALITTVSRFIMMFWGPVKGWLVQHFCMPLGKFRSWLILVEPVGCILTCCLYVRVTGAEKWVGLFYGVMWVVAQVVGDFSEVAALGLLPLLAKTDRDRISITTLRGIMNSAGTIIYSLITLPLVNLFGSADLARGYFVVMVIYNIIDILGYWGTAWSGKEVDIYPDKGRKRQGDAPACADTGKSIPVRSYVECFFRNPPLLLHFSGNLLKAISTMVMNGAMSYYFTYVIGDLNVMTVALLLCNLAMLLGNLFSTCLTRMGVSKKTGNVIAQGLFAFGLIAACFLWPGRIESFVFFSAIARFGSAMNVTLSPAMYADIAEYYENKTGINASGFIFTFFNWVFQIASVCTAGLVAGTLAAVGFDASGIVTPEQINVIRYLATLLPGLIALAGCVCFAFYPLTDRRMKTIRAELELRRKQDNAPLQS